TSQIPISVKHPVLPPPPPPITSAPLSKSNSNSSLMQLPSVNLAELSNYLPHNLSKSSS
ncbi:unnamed protein product, partial [Sphagnum compactum]